MNMPPTTYKDWRDVLHREVHWFGLCTHTLQRYRMIGFTGADDLLVEQIRRWWRRFDRISRIERRLEVEHEAMDDTFIEAIAEWVDNDES